jgi:hypothetical protein
VPYGQASPAVSPVQYPQFLQPGQVSTGFTPQMVSQINSPPPTMAAQQAAAGGPPPPQGGNSMRDLIAQMIARNQRNTTDARAGGTFNGTNAMRQEILRNTRRYNPGGSGDRASGGSAASGSGGGGRDAWGGLR